jgi:crossover junction endodeoxyribonuclease RuvC
VTILGIDPGLATTGYGVIRREDGRPAVVDCGVVRTKAGLPIGERLELLRKEIVGLVRRLKPDSAAIERLLVSNNQKTAMDVARASGVILLALSEAGCPCTEYSPPEVKLAVTGVGTAEKHQVAYMVCRLLGLSDPPKPDDAADALAVALCHGQSRISRFSKAGRAGASS